MPRALRQPIRRRSWVLGMFTSRATRYARLSEKISSSSVTSPKPRAIKTRSCYANQQALFNKRRVPKACSASGKTDLRIQAFRGLRTPGDENLMILSAMHGYLLLSNPPHLGLRIRLVCRYTHCSAVARSNSEASDSRLPHSRLYQSGKLLAAETLFK